MKRSTKVPQCGAKVPVTIGSGIPDEWKVEYGYAEWRNPAYTNPREGDRVHVMPTSSAWSGYAHRMGTVVRNAYSSGSSTLIGVQFDGDDEPVSVSNQVLLREDSQPWARLRPGVDVERMTFHYLYGKIAPPNHYGAAAAQFNYKRRGKRADQDAEVVALTGIGAVELAAAA